MLGELGEISGESERLLGQHELGRAPLSLAELQNQLAALRRRRALAMLERPQRVLDVDDRLFERELRDGAVSRARRVVDRLVDVASRARFEEVIRELGEMRFEITFEDALQHAADFAMQAHSAGGRGTDQEPAGRGASAPLFR